MALVRRAGSKIAEYCRNVANDYATVAKETVTGSRERPIRAAVVLSALGALGYAFATNPTEEDMLNLMAEKRQQLVMVPNAVHNPSSTGELQKWTTLINQKRMEYYDCFVFSLLVAREHDARAKLYSAQDSNLKKWIWQEIWDNIVDIGAFGRFHNLEKSFIDYDINSAEFPEEQKSA